MQFWQFGSFTPGCLSVRQFHSWVFEFRQFHSWVSLLGVRISAVSLLGFTPGCSNFGSFTPGFHSWCSNFGSFTPGFHSWVFECSAVSLLGFTPGCSSVRQFHSWVFECSSVSLNLSTRKTNTKTYHLYCNHPSRLDCVHTVSNNNLANGCSPSAKLTEEGTTETLRSETVGSFTPGSSSVRVFGSLGVRVFGSFPPGCSSVW